MKTVSIILPVYNGATYLAQTIESILGQTYTYFELLVVYDISTDNSLDIIHEFCRKDARITLIHNNIGGRLPGALNAGFANAKGDYYTWWSDDNIMYPNLIEKMVDCLNTHSEYGVVTCNFINIDADNNHIHTAILNTQQSILVTNNFSLLFLYRKEIAEKTGIYDTSQFLVEDYEYFIRMSLITKRYHIPEILGQVRFHEQSLTNQHQKTIRQKDAAVKYHYFEKFKPILNANDCFKVLVNILKFHVDKKVKLKVFYYCVSRFPQKSFCKLMSSIYVHSKLLFMPNNKINN